MSRKGGSKRTKKGNNCSIHAFLLFHFICLVIFTLGPVGASLAMPRLILEERVHNFGTVFEGEKVSHDFSIENRGDTPLNILTVRSTCGCTATSYTKEILPGEKGKIRIRFDSKGYGGETVKKIIHIETDDPKYSRLDLSITGHVDKIAHITPESAILKGHIAEKIETELSIILDKRHPFKVLEAAPKYSKEVSCNLKQADDSDPVKYILTITNLRKKKGSYRDVICLKTDSDIQPIISIRVRGDIRE